MAARQEAVAAAKADGEYAAQLNARLLAHRKKGRVAMLNYLVGAFEEALLALRTKWAAAVALTKIKADPRPREEALKALAQTMRESEPLLCDPSPSDDEIEKEYDWKQMTIYAMSRWRDLRSTLAVVVDKIAEAAEEDRIDASPADHLVVSLRTGVDRIPTNATWEKVPPVVVLLRSMLRRAERNGRAKGDQREGPALPDYTDQHRQVLEILVKNHPATVKSGDIKVPGLTVAKTKWRTLDDLRTLGLAELVDGSKRWQATPAGLAKGTTAARPPR